MGTSNTETPEGRDEGGLFAKGNRFWEARSRAGRFPKFETAEQLAEACLDYFEWVETNPLYEAKAFAYEGNVTIANLPKMRAMTVTGLCLFLDIETRTWRGWKSEKDPLFRSDLLPVIRRVEDAIYTQKFEGASADLLNGNIIARDLGLADKKELGGPDGGPVPVQVSINDAARQVAFLLAKAAKESP